MSPDATGPVLLVGFEVVVVGDCVPTTSDDVRNVCTTFAVRSMCQV